MKKTNKTVKVSIIVPVYNVEIYIERCLNSLINQSFDDYEIIIIDDGSTDNSGKICDEYALKHKCIKVIHQKNSGLSSARNIGIKQARGSYILFVDSDDFIDEYACQKLYETIKKYDADIVRANSIVVQGEKYLPEKKKAVIENDIYKGKEFLVENVKKGVMPMCAQFALYKKEIIENNKIYFKEGFLHEDELWTPQIYLISQKVVWLDYDFYYHYVRENSITHAKNKVKNANDLIEICFELYNIYFSLDKYSKNILLDYVCMLYLNAIFIGKIYDANKFIPMKTAHSLKNKLKACLYFFSPHLYCWINKRIKGRTKKVS